MVSITVDYNFVQVLIWAIIAVIAWFFKKSIDKTNEYLNVICTNFNVVQNTLSSLSTDIKFSSLQTQVVDQRQIQLIPKSLEDLVKEYVKEEASKITDKLVVEEKELEEGGDIG